MPDQRALISMSEGGSQLTYKESLTILLMPLLGGFWIQECSAETVSLFGQIRFSETIYPAGQKL
jgi:hypothetical protein